MSDLALTLVRTSLEIVSTALKYDNEIVCCSHVKSEQQHTFPGHEGGLPTMEIRHQILC